MHVFGRQFLFCFFVNCLRKTENLAQKQKENNERLSLRMNENIINEWIDPLSVLAMISEIRKRFFSSLLRHRSAPFIRLNRNERQWCKQTQKNGSETQKIQKKKRKGSWEQIERKTTEKNEKFTKKKKTKLQRSKHNDFFCKFFWTCLVI